jgi:hypothetical protein
MALSSIALSMNERYVSSIFSVTTCRHVRKATLLVAIPTIMPLPITYFPERIYPCISSCLSKLGEKSEKEEKAKTKITNNGMGLNMKFFIDVILTY